MDPSRTRLKVVSDRVALKVMTIVIVMALVGTTVTVTTS